MKTKLAMLVVGVLSAQVSFADGFRCQAVDGSINAQVFNHTNPNQGTRVASVLILSDPTVQHGNRTIATFKNVQGTLTNYGTSYVANVDLRFTEISRKGEYLFGTRLGELKTIRLDVDFSYNEPLSKGEMVKGIITAWKRSGQRHSINMECERYLKN